MTCGTWSCAAPSGPACGAGYGSPGKAAARRHGERGSVQHNLAYAAATRRPDLAAVAAGDASGAQNAATPAPATTDRGGSWR